MLPPGTCRDTQGLCASGVFAVTLDEAVLPAQPLCPSNHCRPLAGTGVASARAAKWMRDAGTEPAVPPGTRRPGLPGRGTVMSPVATIPVLGLQVNPGNHSPVGCGV